MAHTSARMPRERIIGGPMLTTPNCVPSTYAKGPPTAPHKAVSPGLPTNQRRQCRNVVANCIHITTIHGGHGIKSTVPVENESTPSMALTESTSRPMLPVSITSVNSTPRVRQSRMWPHTSVRARAIPSHGCAQLALMTMMSQPIWYCA